jgi:hypothetical protein
MRPPYEYERPKYTWNYKGSNWGPTLAQANGLCPLSELQEAEPDSAPFTYCRKVQRTDASLNTRGADPAVAVMAFTA